jgi:hypothetical protein
MKAFSARQQFLAALGLYLVWVGVLVVMAVTTSTGPPTRLIEDGPVQNETLEGGAAPAGTVPSQ